jgi:hypothetical protein
LHETAERKPGQQDGEIAEPVVRVLRGCHQIVRLAHAAVV